MLEEQETKIHDISTMLTCVRKDVSFIILIMLLIVSKKQVPVRVVNSGAKVQQIS